MSPEASVAIVGQRLTLEEFLALPEEKPALEYIDGEVIQKVSPKIRHSRLQLVGSALFTGYGHPRRLADAFPELRVTFAGRSSVPDIAVFVWDRIPSDEHGNLPDDVTIPPDIVVEIVSPNQSVPKLVEHCRWYVANGVRIALLWNPEAPRGRWVRAFRPGAETGLLQGSDRVELGDVIPGLAFVVDELFAHLRSRPRE